MRITAVMPAYNEESRIRDTIADVQQYVDEVLVVDDASTDNTATVAEAAGDTVFRNAINSGYISAIKKGFKEASGDIVVTVDADGELPADKIPSLVRPVAEGQADMVQGKRDRIVRPSERLLTWLASWKGPVGDSGTGFRALKVDFARQLEVNGNCICGIFALEVLGVGGRITEIPIQLQAVDKPRGVAWYHLGQLFYLLKYMLTTTIKK